MERLYLTSCLQSGREELRTGGLGARGEWASVASLCDFQLFLASLLFCYVLSVVDGIVCTGRVIAGVVGFEFICVRVV